MLKVGEKKFTKRIQDPGCTQLYVLNLAKFCFANMQPKKYYGGPKAFRMAGKVDKSIRCSP